MLISIIFIIVALILYTLAIWSERIKKKLKPWMVYVFSSGFFCDLIGTSIMFFKAEHKFPYNIHTFCGYAALLIMFLHLIWALLAILKHGKCEEYFTRFSRMAWLIWLLAFLTGIPR